METECISVEYAAILHLISVMFHKKRSRKRSLQKTISWRIVATVIKACVAYLLTGRADIAIEIGLLDTTIKLFAYYAHERAWERADA